VGLEVSCHRWPLYGGHYAALMTPTEGAPSSDQRSEPDPVTAAYVELRARIIDLIDELGDDADDVADRPVPACPRWSVRNLISHLVGVPEDVLEGRLSGVATNEWTAAQVQRHRNDSLLQLRNRLIDLAPRFDPIIAQIPPAMAGQFLMDAVSHEHDLREAIDRRGAGDSTAVTIALDWLLHRRAVPDDLVVALRTCDAPDLTIMRALTGRLTIAQMHDAGLPAHDIAATLDGAVLSLPAGPA